MIIHENERRCSKCRAVAPITHFYKAGGNLFSHCKACSYGYQRKRMTLRRGAGVYQPFPVRFWAKVDRSGGEESCWPFLGVRDHKGYGRLHTQAGSRLAHRVAWELTNGELQANLCALHTCDNPPCCNPSHLRLGTDADNKRDMHSKGRLKTRYPHDPDLERSVRIVSILGLRHVENAALHGISNYRVAKFLGIRCG